MKSKLAIETKLGRQTLYDLLDEEKPFNPGIKTLAPLLKTLEAITLAYGWRGTSEEG